MFRSLVFAVSLLAGVAASAAQLSVNDVMMSLSQQAVMADAGTTGLNLKKGDECNYKLSLSGLSGTMKMLVMDVVAEGVWIQQLVNVIGQKQDMRQLIDPNTGEVKRLIVNGKEEKPPAKGDIEVIETRQEKIKVPAGTFDTVYIKANVKNNDMASKIEQWANMRDIPVMGMVKMTAESQYGPMTLELTSFKRM